MNRSARTRAIFTCFSLACCFTAFSFRLADIQVSRHEDYARQALAKHVHRQTSYARRGSIQDIKGEVLAEDEPVKTVVADATLIADEDMADVASVLSGPLEIPEAELREKLARQVPSEQTGELGPCPYIILKKEVPESVAELIAQKIAEKAAQDEQAQKNAPKAEKSAQKKDKSAKEADRLAQQKHASKWRSVFFEQSAIRVYPNDHLLCHVVGFVDHSGAGMEGVERSMDKFLRGIEGFRYTERDRKGTEIVPYRGEERPACNGNDVRLTIDMGLQNIVESEMDAAIKQFHPKGGATIILMNPKTGEILAMSNRPNYNPNMRIGVPEESRKNKAIADMVEPGSTFKIVTTSAALTEKIVDLDTKIFCENGLFAAYKLHDHHPYGDLSVGEILVKSSNIGAAKLAIQLGEQRFYEYVRRFGFGERTGVNLPGEIAGVVYPPHRWSKISITRMPMGQEVGATPLQVATAMCAIANGGHLMMPQIIHEVLDEHGRSVTQFPPQEIRRVASKEATNAVREALEQVVGPKGTAALAHVAGFRVAGKTGTAQKADADHHYDHENYVVSFVGFMPAEDPAFVGLVMLDEAQTKHGENYGGMVAAPVFSRIGERAARYLGLKPNVEEPPGSILAGQTLNFRDQ